MNLLKVRLLMCYIDFFIKNDIVWEIVKNLLIWYRGGKLIPQTF